MLETLPPPDAPDAEESTTDALPSKHLRFAIIPSNGRACLDDCVQAIQPQVDLVILVNTTEQQFLQYPVRSATVHQIYAFEALNISSWWNDGLRQAEHWATFGHSHWKRTKNQPEVTWDVAILNDDAIVPPGWMEAVSSNMRQHGAVAGCSGNHDVVLRKAEAAGIDMRMQGFAFVLAGEKRIRADETFSWYYSDNYIDWESREQGGMAMMRGFPVQHLYPNGQVTPLLQVEIAKNAAAFYERYGRMPH